MPEPPPAPLELDVLDEPVELVELLDAPPAPLELVLELVLVLDELDVELDALVLLDELDELDAPPCPEVDEVLDPPTAPPVSVDEPQPCVSAIAPRSIAASEGTTWDVFMMEAS